jgi:hypothetical protein
MAIIDNTLAAQVPTFDPATPLMQAAKLQAADQESRQAQFKQAQLELGTEARGLAAVQNSPEFPKLWAEAADRMHAKGLLDARAHSQWRNTPSPLLLKQMIAQTEDPTLQFRKEEAKRDQGNRDRDWNYGPAEEAADRQGAAKVAGVDPNSPRGQAYTLNGTLPEASTTFSDVMAQRKAQAQSVGLAETDPAYKPFMLTGKMHAAGQEQKSEFRKALDKKDADRVNDYSDSARLAEEGTATLDRIDGLQKQAFTGPIQGRLADAVGHPATQALNGAVNELSLDIAQKMKGSLSDKDIAFVKSQTPSLAMGGTAGEAASGAIRGAFERTKQRAAFYRTWAEKNGGIDGADAAWKKYIDENPLTVEDKKALGGRKFNPDYNKDFGRYIKKGQSGYGGSGDSMLAYAREALAQGAPRAEIEKRLVGAGIDPKDL